MLNAGVLPVARDEELASGPLRDVRTLMNTVTAGAVIIVAGAITGYQPLHRAVIDKIYGHPRDFGHLRADRATDGATVNAYTMRFRDVAGGIEVLRTAQSAKSYRSGLRTDQLTWEWVGLHRHGRAATSRERAGLHPRAGNSARAEFVLNHRR